ncbi:MAG TPA: hypothetical protein VK184_18185 [Nostocaceae cyanobacterium]|nr:hypothetical protein [Nostocaceae cyanobacterium]
MMTKSNFHPDDLPPSRLTHADKMLLENLEVVVSSYFHANCGGIIRALLSHCQWHIQINSSDLILIIVCPEVETYLHIINAVPDIAKKLKGFSPRAIIRLCPPIDHGAPWDIGINEIPISGRWLHG